MKILRRLPETYSIKKRALVLDIDDTILKANPEVIGIWKLKDGKETRLTTAEYATDPDKKNGTAKYSYREFQNPELVYKSIVTGTPVLRNLRLMDDKLRKGYDVMFLTARACEDTIYEALSDFLKFRRADGTFTPVGDRLIRKLSAAINESSKTYEGLTDAEKKANVLKKICKEYDEVIFVDDDMDNVITTRKLNLPNLKVVVAQPDDLKENKKLDFHKLYVQSKLEESRVVSLVDDDVHKYDLLSAVLERLNAPNVVVVKRGDEKMERFRDMLTGDDREWGRPLDDKEIIEYFKKGIKVSNMHVCAYDKNDTDYIYIFTIKTGEGNTMYSKVYIDWDEGPAGRAYIISFHRLRGRLFDDRFMSEDRPNTDFFKKFWLDNVEKNIKARTNEEYIFRHDGYQDFSVRVNTHSKELSNNDISKIAQTIIANQHPEIRCIKLQLIAKYKQLVKFRVIFSKPNYLPEGEDEDMYSKTEFKFSKE